jgi:hypothetical protein
MCVNSRLKIQEQFWKTLYVGTLQGIGLKEMKLMSVDKRKLSLIFHKVSLCLWIWIKYSVHQSILQCPPWSPAYDFSEVSNLIQNVWHKYFCFKKCLEEGYIKLSVYVVGSIQNSNLTYSNKFKLLQLCWFTECLLIDCDKGKLCFMNIWRTEIELA